MLFPWNRYEEIEIRRANTLQVFITNICNLKCPGCFSRNVMEHKDDVISIKEYEEVIKTLLTKGGEKVNLLGGEPTLHPLLKDIIQINKDAKLRTTIYTNGGNMHKWDKDFLHKCFKDTNDTEFKYCWSLCNLQPLWAKDNLSKNNKVDFKMSA